MTPCLSCGTAFADELATCPYCRAPRAAGLARGGLDAESALSGGLTRAADPLAHAEPLSLLTRALEQDLAGPLAPAELEAALARGADAAAPSVGQLEGLLALADTGSAAVELDGITLGALLDRDAAVATILRRGLAFLKRGKFAEAAEWWSLHRSQLDPTKQRLDLLLLLLEAFTHTLAGDHARAAAVRAQIRKHPLYLKLRARASLARP